MKRREAATTVPRSTVPTSERPLARGARYELEAVLGEGGMSEVLLCRDHHLDREVALKRTGSLREARLQGQLDHPAIVPVHDVGVDETGKTYFTMRRVRGNTLGAVLDDLREGVEPTTSTFSLHKLLAAFVRVALAAHYAHTRGVVHRDLKPDNVMLGDFGEVYVLDWGVAKTDAIVLAESGERPCLPEETKTSGNALVGTPLYMAPEQIRGDEIDARADVYALGAMLFEILTLVPLHPTVDASSLRDRAVRGVDARASLRTPDRDVPPELEAICVRATAFDPAHRYASAGEMAAAVESFLSGDRDLATRRELAARHTQSARELAEAALGPEGTLEHRAHALEQIGRAIALDQENATALEILGTLLRDAPEKRPPEVERELEAAYVASRRVGLRRATVWYALAGPLVFLPAWALMGLKSALLALLCVAGFVASGLSAALTAQNGSFTKRFPVVSLVTGIALALTTFSFGPFVFAPTLIVVNTMVHAIVGRREHRFQIVAIGALSLLVPFCLEAFGLTASTFRYDHGSLVLSSPLVRFDGASATAFFLFVHLGLVIGATLGIRRYRDVVASGEERTLMQAWLLRHLVPETARAVTSEPPGTTRITKP